MAGVTPGGGGSGGIGGEEQREQREVSRDGCGAPTWGGGGRRQGGMAG